MFRPLIVPAALLVVLAFIGCSGGGGVPHPAGPAIANEQIDDSVFVPAIESAVRGPIEETRPVILCDVEPVIVEEMISKNGGRRFLVEYRANIVFSDGAGMLARGYSICSNSGGGWFVEIDRPMMTK